MDLLLHAPDDAGAHRPDPRGRLSTVGHAEAFKAFARAAKRTGVRFMVIGGTFRDVAVRAASTRDIDIVLVDQQELPAQAMRKAGFTRVPRSPHAWRYVARGRTVDLEIAAVASSETSTGEARGPFSFGNSRRQSACGPHPNPLPCRKWHGRGELPFHRRRAAGDHEHSVAYEHARTAKIEGVTVPVPRIEDYVILKLLAAVADRRRLRRDLADVQYALAAFPETAHPSLSIPALRGRLRDLYGVRGPRLNELVALLRETRRLLKVK